MLSLFLLIILILILAYLFYVINVETECNSKYKKEKYEDNTFKINTRNNNHTYNYKTVTNNFKAITSTTFTANVWLQNPSIISFPELCASNMYGNNIPDINKVSIAIGG